MKKPQLYTLGIFVIPVLSVGIASGVNAYEWHRLQTLETQLHTTTKEIQEARQLIAGIEKRGKSGFIAAVPDTPQEQVGFVSALRTTASQTHVRLTQWGVAPPPIAPPEGTPPEAKELLAKVTPISNQVGVSGTYDEIRAFLYALTGQERLVTLSGIKWTRATDPPATTLSFQLTRYVGALDAPTPPAAQ